MKYMGSKNRIAKDILPIMLAKRKPGQWWVEPFVGGANMIDKVAGNKRLGNDTNRFLIALLKAVRDGHTPPTEISKELYYAIKSNPQKYPEALVGFVGFLCSFGGKWWGGYASDKKGRNCAKQGANNLIKQAKNLSGVTFKTGSYMDLEIPENSLVYCDPPYAGTTGYKQAFDHTVFWQWCRDMVNNRGHTLFISEYSAPDDFVCIKEIQHYTRINKGAKLPRIEKLFRYQEIEDLIG